MRFVKICRKISGLACRLVISIAVASSEKRSSIAGPSPRGEVNAKMTVETMLVESKGRIYDRVFCERLGLTHREGEVLAWVTDGKTNAEIGVILGTSPRTVQKHLEHIYRKLGVETRMAAAVRLLTLTSSQG